MRGFIKCFLVIQSYLSPFKTTQAFDHQSEKKESTTFANFVTAWALFQSSNYGPSIATLKRKALNLELISVQT